MARKRRTKLEVQEEQESRLAWYEKQSKEKQESIWLQFYKLYNKKIAPFVRRYFGKSYYYKIDELVDEALLIGFNQFLRFYYGKEMGLEQYKDYDWPTLEKIILNNVKHELILSLQKESAVVSIEEMEEEQESEFEIIARESARKRVWNYLVKVYNDLKEVDIEAAEFFANLYMGKLIFRTTEAVKRYMKENKRRVTLLKFWLNQLYGVEFKVLP